MFRTHRQWPTRARLGASTAGLTMLGATSLLAQTAPKVISACYVPLTGTDPKSNGVREGRGGRWKARAGVGGPWSSPPQGRGARRGVGGCGGWVLGLGAAGAAPEAAAAAIQGSIPTHTM